MGRSNLLRKDVGEGKKLERVPDDLPKPLLTDPGDPGVVRDHPGGPHLVGQIRIQALDLGMDELRLIPEPGHSPGDHQNHPF